MTLIQRKSLWSSLLDAFPCIVLREESCEFCASIYTVVYQEENETAHPLLDMLKTILHAAATIVVFVALATLALQILCTEAYADSGILSLKVRPR